MITGLGRRFAETHRAPADLEKDLGGWCLVTGASRGIGAAFARALAERGHDLVLAARSTDDLETSAAALRKRYGVRVRTETIDLAVEGAGAALAAAIVGAGIEVDLLVNNAGIASHGRLERIDPAVDHRLVMVNVVAVADLCHAFLPGMVERDRGLIINVASLGGFQPAPYLAAYAASKAFVLSYSEALASELEGTGVRAVALCPGPVRTSFFDGLGSTEAAVGQQVSATAVVEIALRQASRGRRVIVPGRLNALTAQAARLLPRRTIAGIAKRIVGPGPSG